MKLSKRRKSQLASAPPLLQTTLESRVRKAKLNFELINLEPVITEVEELEADFGARPRRGFKGPQTDTDPNLTLVGHPMFVHTNKTQLYDQLQKMSVRPSPSADELLSVNDASAYSAESYESHDTSGSFLPLMYLTGLQLC